MDLSPDQLDLVRLILRRCVPEFEVRAFGSRVYGSARRLSDLDLAIMTDRPLPLARSAELREAFTDSDLPFKVDFVDWAATDDAFKALIARESEVVQTGTGQSAAAAPAEPEPMVDVSGFSTRPPD